MKWDYVDRSGGPDACWPWTRSLTAAGYGQYTHRRQHHYAHRSAYEAVNGPIPDGALIRHLCNNPRCCNPQHLALGDKRSNMADAIAVGAHTHGERSPASKLTDDTVREILARCAASGRGKYIRLAREFGVSEALIRGIDHGKKWKHITRPLGG